jgi:hypothetical protein
MTAILAFFTSSWFKYVAILVIVGGLLGFVWYKGDMHGSAKLTAYKVAQADAAAKIVVKQAAVTTKVVTEYVHDLRIIHEKAATIIKTVPVYVTKYDDSRCTINNGFVRVWQYSNDNTVPPAPASTDETPSPLVLSDIATEHAKEAELFNEQREQLMALQKWVIEQQRASK